eukprot:344975-Pleurochrysis_carterae.AAC.5
MIEYVNGSNFWFETGVNPQLPPFAETAGRKSFVVHICIKIQLRPESAFSPEAETCTVILITAHHHQPPATTVYAA